MRGLPDGPSGGAAATGRKADRVHTVLRHRILDGTHPPGAQLTEPALATAFGVSQSTVREALLKLAEEGLVERRSYRGTVVTSTRPDEAAEMVRIRFAIERLSMSRLSLGTPDLSEARAVAERMNGVAASGDVGTLCDLDRDFHLSLARTGGLNALAPILLRCMVHTQRMSVRAFRDDPAAFRAQPLTEEHLTILAAIAEGPEAARIAIAEHMRLAVTRAGGSLAGGFDSEMFSD